MITPLQPVLKGSAPPPPDTLGSVLTTPCPCGSGATYDACCGPLLLTRPDDTTPDPATRWTGLRVLAAEGDTVEFVASWEGGQMHEVSRFERRAGRWVYVDGDVDPVTPPGPRSH